MPKLTHEQLVKKALSDPKVKAEYDALEGEYSIIRQLISARKKAGLTQEQVAKSMGTSTSVVGRLEATLSSTHHSPSLATLNKYVSAFGCHLEIKVVPNQAGGR
jgi:DNA-binding XRE family transcriptional regulator